MKFLLYRNYVAVRQDANNAIMALLAGSRLAAHTLQLTDGSHKLLAEIFPAVPHISRFNLTTEDARSLLYDADSHLGAIAVPYAQAVHEDFVMSCLAFMRKSGISTPTPDGKQLRSANMHETLFQAASFVAPTSPLAHFQLLRHMRNCQIHSGGRITSGLRTHVAGLSTADATAWTALTGREPQDIIGGSHVVFTTGDIVASFAVTKALGRSVNAALRMASIPFAHWAAMIVEDFSENSRNARNSDQWMRALLRYGAQNYRHVYGTDAELEDAAITLGYWTRGKGVVPPKADRVAKKERKKQGGSSH